MAMTPQELKDIEFRAKGVRWIGELSVLRWLGPDGMDSTAQALLDEVRRLRSRHEEPSPC